ncbi:haloacid dehalogenase, type II [Aspergillus clavatus NRRL 1]|uniref:Haloacid dehalogenase, type II n=1 Tax=Aspergillus clavatus (strain ATCC 1007 / CBS 513.65 / DSM 816 / NCTC 3887 / NRRL 1 / QM 1276 / 107) TaxID=344612 RepID=A1CC22_ASPCL|nr:haloacid dehalogenase, type II [Aspergillus clavatus NRRL 1]EAW13290.1 haloacid dehalogenase, type II [Aspergillus clavatus NRRL 1]
MGTQRNPVVAFDLYGTILSTDSIVEQLKGHFPLPIAQSLSTSWRRYQLEYTWRLNSMDRYDSFDDITRNSLHQALLEHGEAPDHAVVNKLLVAYDHLSIFPDVDRTLRQLAALHNTTVVVFSNGTQTMVTNSVHHSPDLSPHKDVFAGVITVEDVQKFKPAPAAYTHLARKMGKSPQQMADLWLISANPFDIVGARASGLNAIWVDRSRRGWMDAAIPGLQPTAVVQELDEIVALIPKG